MIIDSVKDKFGIIKIYLYLCIVKKLNENTICGLSERYDAQVIRSKMKEQVVPSKKGGKYKRKKFRLHDND